MFKKSKEAWILRIWRAVGPPKLVMGVRSPENYWRALRATTAATRGARPFWKCFRLWKIDPKWTSNRSTIERHPKMSVCIKNCRFRSHRPPFYENVLFLRQSHGLIVRIWRAGAMKNDFRQTVGFCRRVLRRSISPTLAAILWTHIHFTTVPRPCFVNPTRRRSQNNDYRCQRSHNN